MLYDSVPPVAGKHCNQTTPERYLHYILNFGALINSHTKIWIIDKASMNFIIRPNFGSEISISIKLKRNNFHSLTCISASFLTMYWIYNALGKGLFIYPIMHPSTYSYIHTSKYLLNKHLLTTCYCPDNTLGSAKQPLLTSFISCSGTVMRLQQFLDSNQMVSTYLSSWIPFYFLWVLRRNIGLNMWEIEVWMLSWKRTS